MGSLFVGIEADTLSGALRLRGFAALKAFMFCASESYVLSLTHPSATLRPACEKSMKIMAGSSVNSEAT